MSNKNVPRLGNPSTVSSGHGHLPLGNNTAGALFMPSFVSAASVANRSLPLMPGPGAAAVPHRLQLSGPMVNRASLQQASTGVASMAHRASLQLSGTGNQPHLARGPLARTRDRRSHGAGRPGQDSAGNSADKKSTILDPTEFPSLTSCSDSSETCQILSIKPYVGMVKQPYVISSEDFPALPGTSTTPSWSRSEQGKYSPTTGKNGCSGGKTSDAEKEPPELGIMTHSDGKITNIPKSMVKDQFGIAGLLSFIRVAESDPSLVSLALGQDLTGLGLDLNAMDSLHENFGGPYGEGPVRSEDIDYQSQLPVEYWITDETTYGQKAVNTVREKLLAPLRMHLYPDDLLFHLFYNHTGDALQLLSAAELYKRDWRYHKEEKIWIYIPGGLPVDEEASGDLKNESRLYFFFDPCTWRKMSKGFTSEFMALDKLENEPPVVPPAYLPKSSTQLNK